MADEATTPEKAGVEPVREYPPETYRLMSWSAIQFIHRPTIAALAYTCYAMAGFMVAAVLASFFLTTNVRVEAPGEIIADPGILEIDAATPGLFAAQTVSEGARVAKNDVIGMLQMELPEADLSRILQGLDQNAALVERVSRASGLDPKIETGRELTELHDDSIRQVSASLQASIRQLAQDLSGEGEFQNDKNDVARLSLQLKGIVSAYLERHRLRAPADGTLLQFDLAPNANVRADEPVAELLPVGARLAVRLNVEARDFPNIQVGQSVFHQVDAFPFQHYGLFEGEILRVEEARNEKGSVHYSALASIRNPKRLSSRLAAQIRLIRGMATASQIVTGHKSIYDAVMDDFFRQK